MAAADKAENHNDQQNSANGSFYNMDQPAGRSKNTRKGRSMNVMSSAIFLDKKASRIHIQQFYLQVPEIPAMTQRGTVYEDLGLACSVSLWK
jgi:hypothetical protein